MSLSLEQIADIIKMVGLVAGGLWAAWTFHKLQRVRAAELENNATLVAIQKSSIEQEELRTKLLRQQPQLDIQLDVVEKAPLTDTYKSSLCVTVILKNEGEQNLEVEFFPSALTIGRIVFDKGGMQVLDVYRFQPISFAADDDDFPPSDEPHFMGRRRFRVGQKRKIALGVLPIQVPGAYIVQFQTVYERVPFDGEEPFSEGSIQINAIEQTIYFATGNPA
jgi:hypothetical protein